MLPISLLYVPLDDVFVAILPSLYPIIWQCIEHHCVPAALHYAAAGTPCAAIKPSAHNSVMCIRTKCKPVLKIVLLIKLLRMKIGLAAFQIIAAILLQNISTALGRG